MKKRDRTRKIAAINEMKYGHEIICLLIWGCTVFARMQQTENERDNGTGELHVD